MAKAPAPPDPAAILKGLRKALVGPCLLTGNGDEPLFPSGVRGRNLANAAVELGFLTVRVERRAGGTRRPVEVKLGELTELDRKHVLATDDPKPILESLLSAVQSINTPTNLTQVPPAFNDAVEKARINCAKTIEQAYTKQQELITQAIAKLEQTLATSLLAYTPAPVPDTKPILSAIQATLDRISAPAPMPDHSTTLPHKPSIAALEDAITSFVTRWAKEKSVGCQFDVLWNHLIEANPSLSIGDFQNALRTLYRSERIRLGGWARMLDEIPQPELALFVSSKVMYYVHPAQSVA